MVGLFGGSLRRGVAEGFDADVLRFGFVPAGRVVAVGPEVEVDLLFVGGGDVVCAADLVQRLAAFGIAYCPGDAIRRPVHADGGAAEVVRPGVAGAHFDGVVGRPVGEKALQVFAAPARDFDGVEFAVAGDGGFYPFVGEEVEDGVGVEVGEVAARAARCHDFIMAMPQGYQTRVGDIGGKLSGGERQRITIARAILQNRPVLILNEATAFADAENEALLMRALAVLMQDKTVLMIAHRLATIRHAAQILVFDHGQLVEQGDHASFIAQNGRYARLWQAGEAARHWRIGSAEQ